jgi:hypothetical protein
MRSAFLCFTGFLASSGCSRLGSIPHSPKQTAESWLQIQPFVDIKLGSKDIILVQPSSTVFVYLLGALTVGVGLYFLRIREDHRSRIWWGIALLLWGLGALSAGTSYQAFSYEIKCAGREFCSWTSWWEVGYLLLSLASVNAMMMAQAYSCSAERWRKVTSLFALASVALYVIVVLIGALVPVKFLISYELLILVAAPNILVFFVLNGWRYCTATDGMDLALLGTWTWLGITVGMYFLYLGLDITQELWAQGIWFSENDVLHVGLIIWMIYIAVIVANRVVDVSTPVPDESGGRSPSSGGHRGISGSRGERVQRLRAAASSSLRS